MPRSFTADNWVAERPERQSISAPPRARPTIEARLIADFERLKTFRRIPGMYLHSAAKDQRGFTETEHIEAGVAIATSDGNKEEQE